MKIRPLGDRVLVEPIEEKEQTVGGIIIPDSAKEKPMQGKVVAVGKKTDKDGKCVAFDVKKGDTVLLPKYGGTEVKVGDKKLQLVRGRIYAPYLTSLTSSKVKVLLTPSRSSRQRAMKKASLNRSASI